MALIGNKTNYGRDRLVRRDSHQVRLLCVPLGKTGGKTKQTGKVFVPLMV